VNEFFRICGFVKKETVGMRILSAVSLCVAIGQRV
jgi:hypothetical protein